MQDIDRHSTAGIRGLSSRFTVDSVRGRPLLELGARVWDPDRYHAFEVCYGVMRRMDDLVDQRRAAGTPIPAEEKRELGARVSRWMRDGVGPGSAGELAAVRRRFRIPAWPWQCWTRSMLFDLDHDDFATFPGFLGYAEGAAVAPGAIFMHLCGSRRTGKGYAAPRFDAGRAARPLAIFCYLTHILRDVRADQRKGLNYFPLQVMLAHGLSRADLKALARGVRPGPRFRGLAHDYHARAVRLRLSAREELDRVIPHMEPACGLSLEIVLGLYGQIHERMDPETCGFTARETHPEPADVVSRVRSIIASWEANPRMPLESQPRDEGRAPGRAAQA